MRIDLTAREREGTADENWLYWVYIIMLHSHFKLYQKLHLSHSDPWFQWDSQVSRMVLTQDSLKSRVMIFYVV